MKVQSAIVYEMNEIYDYECTVSECFLKIVCRKYEESFCFVYYFSL